jgi:hypothetical protein
MEAEEVKTVNVFLFCFKFCCEKQRNEETDMWHMYTHTHTHTHTTINQRDLMNI